MNKTLIPLRQWLVSCLWLICLSPLFAQPADSLTRAQFYTQLAGTTSAADSLEKIIAYWVEYGSFERAKVDDRPLLYDAIRLARQLDNLREEQFAYEYLSHQYFIRMEIDSQQHYALKSLALAQQLNNDTVWGNSHFMMTNVHMIKHQYDSAMYHATQAVDYYSRDGVNLPVSLANTYKKMSTIIGRAQRRGNEQSLVYSRKALEICTDEVDAQLHSNFLISMAVDFGFMGKNDSAFHYINIIIERGKRLGQSNTLATGLHMLSEYYYFTDRPKEALQWIDTVQNKGHYQHLSHNQYNNTLLNKTEALYKLGRYQQSLTVAEQLMERAEKYRVGFLMRDLSKHMANLFEQLGQPQDALDMLRTSVHYSDSLFSASQAATVADLEQKYRSAEKDRDLAFAKETQAQQALQFQRRLSIAGLLGLLMILAGTYVFWRNRLQTLKAEKAASNLEQRLLRSQMNPHFAYNTLGSIQNYLLESGESDKAAYYLAKFSKLMRQILDQSRASTIPLEEELETLQNYLSLQQLRYGNTFTYKLNLAPDIDASNTLVPPMLVQPLIENAIEHGKIHTIDNGFVKVDIQRQDGHLRVQVADNGMGKASKKLPKPSQKPTSVATTIIKERLAILRHRYGAGIGYDIIHPKNGGTRVSLQLPYLPAL